MKSMQFEIPQINEDTQVKEVEQGIGSIPGVRTIHGHRQTKIFVIEWEDPATWEDIEATLTRMHYTPKYK